MLFRPVITAAALPIKDSFGSSPGSNGPGCWCESAHIDTHMLTPAEAPWLSNRRSEFPRQLWIPSRQDHAEPGGRLPYLSRLTRPDPPLIESGCPGRRVGGLLRGESRRPMAGIDSEP